MPTQATQVTHVLFDGGRLRLARSYCGLRKIELARELGVSPAAVTQYEQGRVRPARAVVARICLCLGFPPEFFERRPETGTEISEGQTHFRRLRSTSKADRTRLLAHLELLGEVVSVIEQHVDLPIAAFPAVDLGPVTSDRIGNAAGFVRSSWGLGSGPITNVVQLLEAKGAIVVRPRIATTSVDAFSTWLAERPAIVLASDKADAARARFDAAHELGHMVMHHDAEPGSTELEHQADSFASAFLMPADAIESELPRRMDWSQYFELKQRWGVSVQALIRRARDLSVISQHAYERAFVQLSARGWRTSEPGRLGPAEEPTVLRRALALIAGASEIGPDRIAAELRLSPTRLESILSDLCLAA